MDRDEVSEVINTMRNILKKEEDPIDYVSLESFLDFSHFDYANWLMHERTLLEPQLEQMGYTDIKWSQGDYDSFGPLTRVCKAKNSGGKTCWFIYG